MSNKVKNHVQKMVAEIDQAELTVRLLENAFGMKRPVGQSGKEALNNIRKNDESGDFTKFEAMARTSIEYFGECVSALQKTH